MPRLATAFQVIAVAMLLLAPLPARAAETPDEIIAQSTEIVRRFLSVKQWEGVRNILGAARAVYLAPEIKSGSLLVGYEGGTGVMLRRHGDDWSEPVLMHVSRLSVGFQAGVRESDLLLLIMTDAAIEDFITGVSKVSGSGGFALGDLGVSASAAGGVSGGLEILTVSTSKGLALGSGIERMTMSEEKEQNVRLHGAGSTLATVLAKPGNSPGASAALRTALRQAVIDSRQTK